MRTTLLLIVLFLNMGPAYALEQVEVITVTPRLPDFFADRICPTPVWQGQTLVWNGVTDKRSDPVIGYQEKKGQVLVQIVANPTLDQFLNSNLRKLFSVCGVKLIDALDGASLNSLPTLSVEIAEFQTGLEKKLFTGKGTAKSRLTFFIQHADQSVQTAEIGFSIESKKVRSKNVTQLEETITELLYESLNQIPKSQALKF